MSKTCISGGVLFCRKFENFWLRADMWCGSYGEVGNKKELNCKACGKKPVNKLQSAPFNKKEIQLDLIASFCPFELIESKN